MAENTFVIESNKILNVDGVRHEIDIFVTIDLGSDYRSIFVFECKNWEESVGKNEVVILSEKIRISQAQHGYLVAKSFTADALAQAKKDPRVSLLTATEHDSSAPVLFSGSVEPWSFFSQLPRIESVAIAFSPRAPDPNSHLRLRGVTIDMVKFLLDLAADSVKEDLDNSPKTHPGEGIYEYTAESTREFDKGEVTADDYEIKSARVEVKYTIQVLRNAVVSHFDVESRGRVLLLSPTPWRGSTVQVRFTFPTNNSTPVVFVDVVRPNDGDDS